jgi:hypothetical protein
MTIHSFRGHGSGPHMTGTTWQHRLDSAHGVDEIVLAARDFVAGFDPFEIEALPPDCRMPAKIVDADDVTSYAFELVRFECHDHEAAQLVHRLARFFSHASMRLAQITARDRVDNDGRQTA